MKKSLINAVVIATIAIPTISTTCLTVASADTKEATIDVSKINTDTTQIKDAYQKQAKGYQISEITLENKNIKGKKIPIYKIEGFKKSKEIKVTLQAKDLKKIKVKKALKDFDDKTINFDQVKVSFADAANKAKKDAQLQENPTEIELKMDHSDNPKYEVHFENRKVDTEVSLSGQDASKLAIDKDD